MKAIRTFNVVEPEYVGRHRCWIGSSGDVINGECAGKPHMGLRDGVMMLCRADGSTLYPPHLVVPLTDTRHI
jgi:hypothetical protein